MLAASLLFEKIHSNAKVSSSNELMLCLSALPSLVSWDLFLMPFQVSADSLCCGALAVHRALPGPRTAWQRTFADGVLHALLIEEPGSRGNLEAVLCSSLLTWAVAQPGFPGVPWDGRGPWLHLLRCRLVVPLAPSGTCSAACWSPVIITHGTEQHWRGSVLISRRKAYKGTLKREKITPNTFLTLKLKM